MSGLRYSMLFGLILSLLLLTTATPLPAQAPAACAADAVVQSGDTLSLLAARYYGNLAAYPQIVTATNAQAAVDRTYATIANANTLEVGWKLCLPGPLSSTPVKPTICAVMSADG